MAGRSVARAHSCTGSADIMGNSAVLVTPPGPDPNAPGPRHIRHDHHYGDRSCRPMPDRRWTGEPMNQAGRSRPGRLDTVGQPGDGGTPEPGDPAAGSADGDAPASDSAAGDAAAGDAPAGGATVKDSAPGDGGARQAGSADEGPGGPRVTAARRPAVRHLALLVVYLAAGIAVTWPRAAYLTRHQLPETRDVSG